MGKAQFDQYGRLRLSGGSSRKNRSQDADLSSSPQTIVQVPYHVTPDPQPTYSQPANSGDQIGAIVAWCVAGVIGLILLFFFWYIILPLAAVVGFIAGLANDNVRPVILRVLRVIVFSIFFTALGGLAIVVVGGIIIFVMKYWFWILLILFILYVLAV